MGTNFYRIKKISKTDIKNLNSTIESGNLENLTADLESLNEEVHICKRSYGWRMCFDHNWGKYYSPSRKSLDEFLRQPESIIMDEYGESYSPDEFWKIVEEWDHPGPLEHRDIYTMATWVAHEKKKDPNFNEFPCFEARNRCKELFGVNCEYDEFFVDDLRFASYSDFS